MIEIRRLRRLGDIPLHPTDASAVGALQHTLSTYWVNSRNRVWNIKAGSKFADCDVETFFRFERLVGFMKGNTFVDGFQLSDIGIERLVSHPTIAQLFVERCPNITNRSVKLLAGNSWIRWLCLNCESVNDEGMSCLREMNHLLRSV